jgi:hypothetical protein
VISNSIYSIKTAALLWYLVGALDAVPRQAVAAAPAASRPPRSSRLRAMPAG